MTTKPLPAVRLFQKLLLMIFTVFLFIYPSFGQDVSCFSLKVGDCVILNQSIQGKSIELVGTKGQILDLIEKQNTNLHIGCKFFFGLPEDKEFKPTTCINDKVTFHFIKSPGEMLKFYRALIPPRIPPGKDTYKLNSGKGGSTPSGLPCKPQSELCITSKGEMSASICCDDFCFGISSEGEFPVSAGKGPAKVSLTFP